MKVVLKNLGVTPKSLPMLGTNVKTSSSGVKPEPRYPKLTLNSKQIPGLEKYAEKGMKCKLQFEGEIDAFRSADEWTVREEGLPKDAIEVTIKLIKGSLVAEDADDKKEYKSTMEARNVLVEKGMKS